MDENYHLIYGLEAIEAAKKQGKKSVLAWRISLANLPHGKYETHHFKKTFHLFERTAIGIALEICLGERRGRLNVDNYPHLMFKKGIKTRNLITELLGFGSDYTYRQLKKILRHGSPTLINHVLEKKITISKKDKRQNVFSMKSLKMPNFILF